MRSRLLPHIFSITATLLCAALNWRYSETYSRPLGLQESVTEMSKAAGLLSATTFLTLAFVLYRAARKVRAQRLRVPYRSLVYSYLPLLYPFFLLVSFTRGGSTTESDGALREYLFDFSTPDSALVVLFLLLSNLGLQAVIVLRAESR